MNDRAAQVWRKAWNAAVHEGQYSKGEQLIAAYGQEQRREGMKSILRFFEDGDEDTMWRPHEITDAIERLLTKQEKEKNK